jgi:Methyltransferase FkbM domain
MTSGSGGLNHVMTARDTDCFVVADFDTLDRLLRDRRATMMKIDVEGLEMCVLRGAQHTLAVPSLRALIVELNGSGARYGFSDQAVHEEIIRHGFSAFAYDPATRSLSV